MRIKNKKGQGILEYAMIISIVLAVFVAIQIYLKRAVQGNLKRASDQIGEQFTTAQNYTIQTITQSARKEDTLASLTVANDGWTRSQIQDLANGTWLADVDADATKVAYAGYEATKTDYVNVTEVGSGELGEHASFDSGNLSNRKLFEDD